MSTLPCTNQIPLSDIKNTDTGKTAIIIRQMRPNDQLRWDEYVKGHPEGTFFHLTGWKNVIEKTFGHRHSYLLAEQSRMIDHPPDLQEAPSSQTSLVGILPLFPIKSFLFGKFLVSTPFAEIGGAIADDARIENLLIQRAVEITKSQDLGYLELRCKDKIFTGFALKNLYYNFRREIFDDLDQNMQAIPRKARRMIRQGEKFNLSFEFGNQNLKSFYGVLMRSFHNLGTPPFTYKFFKNICDEFRENCLLLIIQTQDTVPIAGVLTFFYKDQVLPYYAGSLVEYRELAPNDFMYWQLMKYGFENGYRFFDFGRSKEGTGSFDFKRHWGFEPKPLHYQYYLNKVKEMPNLSPANPKYQKKIKLWKKLPLPVTETLGPLLSKYLV
jgi:FemAB-related protein (PEP-CTERM system-associated)